MFSIAGFNPGYAQAGFFNLISGLISPPKTDSTGSDLDTFNTQTIPLLEGDTNPNINSKGGGEITVVEGGAISPEVGPLGTLSHVEELNRSHEISTYVVRKGDTLSLIAAMFDVSVNTIVWANDLGGRSIKEGENLGILPISGVKHTVKSGETIGGIAKKYKADLGEILVFNGLRENDSLKAGQVITIPDGEAVFVSSYSGSTSSSLSTRDSSKYPAVSGYYIRPTDGIKTQGIHGYNGIDIGSSIGTPVYASAAGVVIIAKEVGWNGGYGEYAVIKHNNGSQTLYAHMNSILVSVGDTVSQGQQIGTVGSTGNSTGPHVHFEIRQGPTNPF